MGHPGRVCTVSDNSKRNGACTLHLVLLLPACAVPVLCGIWIGRQKTHFGIFF